MTDVTYKYVRNPVGGGLGDCKVGIVEFDGGNYIAGGIPIDFGVPIFAISANGNKLDFSTPGKLIIEGASATTAIADTILMIFKG